MESIVEEEDNDVLLVQCDTKYLWHISGAGTPPTVPSSALSLAADQATSTGRSTEQPQPGLAGDLYPSRRESCTSSEQEVAYTQGK